MEGDSDERNKECTWLKGVKIKPTPFFFQLSLFLRDCFNDWFPGFVKRSQRSNRSQAGNQYAKGKGGDSKTLFMNVLSFFAVGVVALFFFVFVLFFCCVFACCFVRV